MQTMAGVTASCAGQWLGVSDFSMTGAPVFRSVAFVPASKRRRLSPSWRL